ncbi:MAG: SPOCS domain-containing protein [Clostridium sp.]
MRCKCTVKDNYEVIGLCKLDKFACICNEEAWTQISVPQVLSLPLQKPDIEVINKIYNSIEITSTSIINTPVSCVPNIEGVKLTGKKLLVEGNVCQTMIYTAGIACNSVHPVNFKIPFCTYIILDPDVDIELDSYCVVPCIEDVYSEILNERTLFMNITMFLLAKKVESSCF